MGDSEKVEIPLTVTDDGATAVIQQAEAALRTLGATADQTQTYLKELMAVPADSRDSFNAPLLQAAQVMEQAAQVTDTWSEAQQRAAMAASGLRDQALKMNAAFDESKMSGLHDQALRMNEAFDESKNSIGRFGEELLKSVGLGAALGGGVAIAIAALEGLKEATIGAFEYFVDFGHQLDILHEKIDVPVELAAAWQQSSSVTGISAESVANSIAMIETRLATGNKQALQAMKELDISVNEFANADMAGKVQMLAKGIDDVRANGGNATVVIRELAGRGGLGLLPFLADDIQNKLIPALKAINGPMGDQVKAAHDYELAWAQVAAQVDAVKRALMQPIVGGLADLLSGKQVSGGGAGSSIVRALTSSLGLGAFAPGGVLGSDAEGPPPPVPWGQTSSSWHMPGLGFSRTPPTGGAGPSKGELQAEDYNAKLDAQAMQQVEQQQQKDSLKGWNDYFKTLKGVQSDAAKAELAQMKDKANAAIGTEQWEQAQRLQVAQIEDQATRVEEQGLKALAAARASHSSSIGDEIAKIDASKDAKLADIDAQEEVIQAKMQDKKISKDVYDAYQDLIDALERSKDDYVAAAEAEKHYALWQGIAKDIGEANQLLHAFVSTLNEMGVQGGEAFSRVTKGMEGTLTGLQGIAKGIGDQNPIEMITGGLEALGGLFSIFHKPEYEKVMDDVGQSWGVQISEGLAKQIESTETKDHVSRAMAELLNISSIMQESGGPAGGFVPQIEQLMDAISSGSVPAVQGLDQLDQAFQQVQKEAEATGEVGSAAMVQLIEHAREAGLQDQTITAYVQQQLNSASSGMEAFFKGLQDMTPQLAAAEGQIFSDTFWATVKEEGIVAAANALGPAYDQAMAQMQKQGIAPSKAWQAVGSTLALGRDPQFQAVAGSVDASDKILKGLADSAYLTKDSFDAFGETAKAQYDEAIKAGATAQQAAQLQQKQMSDLYNASQNYGYQLSQTDKDLIAEMEKSGVSLLKDPVSQQTDILKDIRDGIYKLAGLAAPGSGNGSSMTPQHGPSSDPNRPPRRDPDQDLFERSKSGRVRIAQSAIVPQY